MINIDEELKRISLMNDIGRGEEAERIFREACKQKNIPYKKSTDNENKYKHIDYWIKPNDTWISVEVKCLKKISSSDDLVNIYHQWLEFLNVHGNIGWLLGRAKYILFLMIDELGWFFYMCPKEKLLTFAGNKFDIDFSKYNNSNIKELERKLLDLHISVDNPQSAGYKLYRREYWDRKDICTLVRMIDIYDASIKEFRYESNPVSE